MLKGFRKIILFSAFCLLGFPPTAGLAWHDGRGFVYYGDWDWYGSGRDHPYSYYVSQRYDPGYVYPAFEAGFADDEPYLDHPAPLIVPVSQAPAAAPGEFTINIPNNHGGYTAVVLKKSGTGYVGPQGEFYPEFPKVFQLKMMYGK
jgi:hypothetical protein